MEPGGPGGGGHWRPQFLASSYGKPSLLNYIYSITGKSLSEALIFASTNPQYDNRLFIVHENCKLRIPAEHVVYTNCCIGFV